MLLKMMISIVKFKIYVIAESIGLQVIFAQFCMKYFVDANLSANWGDEYVARTFWGALRSTSKMRMKKHTSYYNSIIYRVRQKKVQPFNSGCDRSCIRFGGVVIFILKLVTSFIHKNQCSCLKIKMRFFNVFCTLYTDNTSFRIKSPLKFIIIFLKKSIKVIPIM